MNRRVNILGVDVSAINMDDALATLDGWIRDRTAHYVCVTGVMGSWKAHVTPHFVKSITLQAW
jgi:UDP-N-acetyl-D-mannosaminuronic acid transferase (WecB/TagA/CpsF family)